MVSLPDISKWNTNNIINMSGIFNECSSLLYLPDISKWNTNNATDMSYMFNGCSSLSSHLIFQFGILIKLVIWLKYFMDALHYHLYLIFQNGVLIIFIISFRCLTNAQILYFQK